MYHVTITNPDHAAINYMPYPLILPDRVMVLYGGDVVPSEVVPSPTPPPPPPPEPPEPREPPITRTVVTRAMMTRVYDDDEGKGKVVGTLLLNTKVTLLETSDHWWGKVVLPSGSIGWLNMNGVSEIK